MRKAELSAVKGASRTIALLAVTLALFACANEGESKTKTPKGFEVENLFMVDGCTVYRFRDVGSYHYFTNCSGSTSSTKTHACGKATCSREEVIAGGREDD